MDTVPGVALVREPDAHALGLLVVPNVGRSRPHRGQDLDALRACGVLELLGRFSGFPAQGGRDHLEAADRLAFRDVEQFRIAGVAVRCRWCAGLLHFCCRPPGSGDGGFGQSR